MPIFQRTITYKTCVILRQVVPDAVIRHERFVKTV